MKRIIYYSIPTLLIVLFVLILNSGNFLKQPMGTADQFIQYLKETKADIQTKRWDDAKDNLTRLKTAWDIVLRRIQVTVELNDVNNLNQAIARLNGSIAVQDQITALVHVSEISAIWDQIGD